ncbi:hypothetical protein [Sporosarcina cyprini]|uniref:hypothetical protein n=1 Tax=Sporosarcina cyprini TaxID=2910523 RepID=UPI001EDF5F38|nr:hypothetical protein [Sporosarcina cyprini]MCG3088325.1 hypothetical protein [Sporosarcina cyprini]
MKFRKSRTELIETTVEYKHLQTVPVLGDATIIDLSKSAVSPITIIHTNYIANMRRFSLHPYTEPSS